jgi:hypothetical protein
MPNEDTYAVYRQQEQYLEDLDRKLDAASTKAATVLFVLVETGIIVDPHVVAVAVAWQQAYRDASLGLAQVRSSRVLAKAAKP